MSKETINSTTPRTYTISGNAKSFDFKSLNINAGYTASEISELKKQIQTKIAVEHMTRKVADFYLNDTELTSEQQVQLTKINFNEKWATINYIASDAGQCLTFIQQINDNVILTPVRNFSYVTLGGDYVKSAIFSTNEVVKDSQNSQQLTRWVKITQDPLNTKNWIIENRINYYKVETAPNFNQKINLNEVNDLKILFNLTPIQNIKYQPIFILNNNSFKQPDAWLCDDSISQVVDAYNTKRKDLAVAQTKLLVPNVGTGGSNEVAEQIARSYLESMVVPIQQDQIPIVINNSSAIDKLQAEIQRTENALLRSAWLPQPLISGKMAQVGSTEINSQKEYSELYADHCRSLRAYFLSNLFIVLSQLKAFSFEGEFPLITYDKFQDKVDNANKQKQFNSPFVSNTQTNIPKTAQISEGTNGK